MCGGSILLGMSNFGILDFLGSNFGDLKIFGELKFVGIYNLEFTTFNGKDKFMGS